MKKILPQLFFYSSLAYGLFLSSTVFAAAKRDYVLMEPILGVTMVGKDKVGDYINTMITLVMSLATALAVIMLIAGGIQIIFRAGSEASRSAARAMIFDALFGLTLIIGMAVFLSFVNPELLNVNF